MGDSFAQVWWVLSSKVLNLSEAFVWSVLVFALYVQRPTTWQKLESLLQVISTLNKVEAVDNRQRFNLGSAESGCWLDNDRRKQVNFLQQDTHAWDTVDR